MPKDTLGNEKALEKSENIDNSNLVAFYDNMVRILGTIRAQEIATDKTIF